MVEENLSRKQAEALGEAWKTSTAAATVTTAPVVAANSAHHVFELPASDFAEASNNSLVRHCLF
jgi:hypothetical protein